MSWRSAGESDGPRRGALRDGGEQVDRAEAVDHTAERSGGDAGLPRPPARQLAEEGAGAQHLVGALRGVLDDYLDLPPVVG